MSPAARRRTQSFTLYYVCRRVPGFQIVSYIATTPPPKCNKFVIMEKEVNTVATAKLQMRSIVYSFCILRNINGCNRHTFELACTYIVQNIESKSAERARRGRD